MNRFLWGIALSLVATGMAENWSALAIDLDASGSVGGVSVGAGAAAGGGGVSAGASATSGGVSAGADADAGGGGVSAGASATSGSLGISAGGRADPAAGSISASGGVKAGGAEISIGVGVGARAAAAPPTSAPDPTPPTPLASPAAAQFLLPARLAPRLVCAPEGGEQCHTQPPEDADLDERTPRFALAITALAEHQGAPQELVTACRMGIIQAALPFDPVRVDVASVAAVQRAEGGGQIAPLMVRIVYDRQGGYETKEAEVACHVDAAGAVVSLV